MKSKVNIAVNIISMSVVLEGRCGGMIIRSQDKKEIVNFDNLEAVKLNEIQISISNDWWDFEISYYDSNGNAELLGIYSTKEKAIKVLDMIQSAYNSIETMKIDKCAWRDNHYFQMPSDEEVEV